jgi:hypothetical protein
MQAVLPQGLWQDQTLSCRDCSQHHLLLTSGAHPYPSGHCCLLAVVWLPM